MKVGFNHVQLKTQIVLISETHTGRQSFTMDVDRWTEFKKAIFDIDKEFYKRFNYQYPDV